MIEPSKVPGRPGLVSFSQRYSPPTASDIAPPCNWPTSRLALASMIVYLLQVLFNYSVFALLIVFAAWRLAGRPQPDPWPRGRRALALEIV